MAWNTPIENHYHHLRYNFRSRAYTIPVTRKKMTCHLSNQNKNSQYTCSSTLISISSQEKPSGNLYGSCRNSSIDLFDSIGPI